MILLVSDHTNDPLFTSTTIRCHRVSPAAALADLGFAIGAELVVLEFAPGTYPLLEAHAFQLGPTLYVWASATTGTVGPLLLPRATPCSSCIALPNHDETPAAAHLRAWAMAGAVVEIHALQHRRGGALAGRALTWDERSGSIATTPTRHRPSCRTPGCAASIAFGGGRAALTRAG
ncbi:hypothetical protein [uncultured Tessaracoccus sp.]|uniref:hypothetical protein n=1 Tax=uncultured Tessaracoccus sp. TaxID=905023 RepID=UPI002619E54C|nr:hypothetical protein [uncultured Tessaracoccus sp.]